MTFEAISHLMNGNLKVPRSLSLSDWQQLGRDFCLYVAFQSSGKALGTSRVVEIHKSKQPFKISCPFFLGNQQPSL